MRPIKFEALALALGVAAVVFASRCNLGIHSSEWQFVGNSWTPDIWIRVCSRCGRQLYKRGDHG